MRLRRSGRIGGVCRRRRETRAFESGSGALGKRGNSFWSLFPHRGLSNTLSSFSRFLLPSMLTGSGGIRHYVFLGGDD